MLDSKSSDGVVSDNTIDWPTAVGIKIFGSAGHELARNRLRTISKNNAFWIHRAKGMRLEGNHVRSCIPGKGDWSQEVEKNNTLKDNVFGVIPRCPGWFRYPGPHAEFHVPGSPDAASIAQ